MATERIYGSTADGRIESSDPNASYATVRAGTGSVLEVAAGSTEYSIGQDFYYANYYLVNEAFISFDLQPFWDAHPYATVSAVELRMYANTANRANGEVFQARLHDWGATLTTADWVAGADLGSKTLLGSFTYDAIVGQKTFTGAGMLSNFPSSGSYRMLICIASTVNNVAPTVQDTVGFRAQEYATENDRPHLVITYTETVSVIYGTANDGYYEAENSTSMANARNATGGGSLSTTGALAAGTAWNNPWYNAYESGIGFDVTEWRAAHPAALISAVELVLTNYNGYVNLDGTTVLEVRLHDWGTDWALADWIPGDNLGDYKLLTSSSYASGTYEARTLTGAALLNHLPPTGFYRMNLSTDRLRTNAAGSFNAFYILYWRSQDYATVAQRPKLLITFTEPANSTRVVYGDLNDTSLLADNGTWANSRDGTGAAVEGGDLKSFTSLIGGPTYRTLQAGVRFDTSFVGTDGTVVDAVLNLEAGGTDNQGTLVVEAHIFDFGDTLAAADWRTAAQLAALTKVATKTMPVTTGTRYDFTNVALPANVNKTGFTYIWLTEEANRTDVTPTTDHYIAWKNADTAGTGSDPRLTVTWHWGASGTRVVYADAGDAHIQSYSTTSYADARAGTGTATLSLPAATMDMGQYHDAALPNEKTVAQAMLSFDTSGIQAAASISSATLNTTHSLVNSSSGHVFEARKHDHGAIVTTGDFVPGDSLSAKTLLATHTGSGAIDSAHDWVNVAFPANIEKDGFTRIVLAAKNQLDNVAPTANHLIRIYPSETAGTTQDPKLTVVFTNGVVHDAAGAAAGVGAAVGAASQIFNVAGVAAGAATVAGVPTAPHSISGVVAGVATAAALADLRHPRLPYLVLSLGATSDLAPVKVPQGTVVII